MNMVGAYGYDAKKASQSVAFFALKSGGKINVLKLVKLLYLAERKFMEMFDEPLFFDSLVSMEHGPVTSTSLNLINGLVEDENWANYVSERQGHEISTANDNVSFDNLDHLSRADVKILSEIWDEFGSLSQFQIRDFTHDNCPEWEDPKGSSKPISYEVLLKFLGKENPENIARYIEDYREFSKNLAEI